MKNITFLFLVITLFSCQQDYIINKTKVIDNAVWNYDNIISFNMEIDDIESLYNLHLIIQHSEEYSYENIYMKIHTQFPSITEKEEQITVQLADRRGDWIGKCNGGSCKIKVFLLEGFKFPEEGQYSFDFEQFTREEGLDAIESLQLQLFKSEAVNPERENN